ncbi:MAG: hypothetical protein OEZ55_12850, partial [Nitrospinota bacterium]|nr:hypothetical protein [Nitrospinota bacterium]
MNRMITAMAAVLLMLSTAACNNSELEKLRAENSKLANENKTLKDELTSQWASNQQLQQSKSEAANDLNNAAIAAAKNAEEAAVAAEASAKAAAESAAAFKVIAEMVAA